MERRKLCFAVSAERQWRRLGEGLGDAACTLPDRNSRLGYGGGYVYVLAGMGATALACVCIHPCIAEVTLVKWL